MNQNVFGVILFSLIVGTAIFVSEYFVPLPTLLPVYERPVSSDNKYTCSQRKRQVTYQTSQIAKPTVKVSQIFFNQRTNQLNTDFLIKAESPKTENVGIALHFFTKDGRKTKYLATETILVKPNFDESGLANYDFISSFKWLNDLNRHDNLYVIAEPSVDFRSSKTLEPNFDSSKATSVLILNER
jgi:hypothetical protein